MKKVLSLLAIAGTLTFFACGPSAEEKAEKARQDSIKAADSIAKAQFVADSISASQAAEKAKQDSVAKADSLAKAQATAKPSKKKK
jgi:hypothetical protein